jgi:hypothetical protein
MQHLLTYCALPSRLYHLTEQTYNFVLENKHAPLHPFKAFEQGQAFGDNGIFGRERVIEFALRMVGICDQLYLFGISDGTLQETRKALDLNIPVKLHIERFDLDWRRYYHELKPKYPFLEKLIKDNNLTPRISKY